MKMRDVVDVIHEQHPEWAKNNIGLILKSVCEEIRQQVETAAPGAMVRVPFLGKIKIKETPKEDGSRRYIFLPARPNELQADDQAVSKAGPQE